MQIGKVTRGFLTFLAAASALAGCAGSPRQAALCELPDHLGTYAGKVLTVEGELLVSKHGSGVSDPSCDKGVSVSWWDKDVPRMRDFDAAAQRLAALEPIVVRVRVTGTVKQARRSEFLNEPYWYLALTSADVVSVKPRP